jgi:DNA-binding response OmpR family regulator
VLGSENAVLVVEDDPSIADLLDLYLRRHGFRALQAPSAERAIEILDQTRVRLAIVDIKLSGSMDGLDFCRHTRARPGPAARTPLLILTARDDEVDRVIGLELGADDYVTKPFSPREVMARVKAILRRSDGGGGEDAREPVRCFGSLCVDTIRREARRGGEPVELSKREFDLLAGLAENPGLVLSRRQILDMVWGPGWEGDERTVDVHVRQLRRKLGDDLPLTTVWGVGYRFG